MRLHEIERDLTLLLRLALRYWATAQQSPSERGKAVKWAMTRHGDLGWYSTGMAESLVTEMDFSVSPDDAVVLDHLELRHDDRTLALKIAELIHSRDEARKSDRDRALIDDLIDATELYDTAKARQDLLNFVCRLRSMAPFNAMLLQTQRPGLTHAATAQDWRHRFNRRPKQTARPLVILRAMGPVDFVFDVNETEGDPLPEAAFSFPTFGEVPHLKWQAMLGNLPRRITITFVDDGDLKAGRIARVDTSKTSYEVWLNKNHPETTQFVTLAHELAHLYLGHLGKDKSLGIASRVDLPLSQRELEAEVAAYVVASRIGVKPKSEAYLKQYLDGQAPLDHATVLRAANAVEKALGISATQLWNHPQTTR